MTMVLASATSLLLPAGELVNPFAQMFLSPKRSMNSPLLVRGNRPVLSPYVMFLYTLVGEQRIITGIQCFVLSLSWEPGCPVLEHHLPAVRVRDSDQVRRFPYPTDPDG